VNKQADIVRSRPYWQCGLRWSWTDLHRHEIGRRHNHHRFITTNGARKCGELACKGRYDSHGPLLGDSSYNFTFEHKVDRQQDLDAGAVDIRVD
jgi:hypothetical protein